MYSLHPLHPLHVHQTTHTWSVEVLEGVGEGGAGHLVDQEAKICSVNCHRAKLFHL